jgi:hypothetical protein
MVKAFIGGALKANYIRSVKMPRGRDRLPEHQAIEKARQARNESGSSFFRGCGWV